MPVTAAIVPSCIKNISRICADSFETRIDGVEPVADCLESRLHTVEASIDGDESRVNAGEPSVHVQAEVLDVADSRKARVVDRLAGVELQDVW